MPKEEKKAKRELLNRNSLQNEMNKPNGKLKVPKKKTNNSLDNHNDYEEDEDNNENIPSSLQKKIYNQARDQRLEMTINNFNNNNSNNNNFENEEEDEYDDNVEEDENDEENLINIEGDYVEGNNLSADEELVVSKFLNINKFESRTLADIIMEKIKQKELVDSNNNNDNNNEDNNNNNNNSILPAKVIEVYTSVGKMLAHYKSGKLPKALKMLPHLKNWEEVLWITRPDEWSPIATYACTRIFASNLNAKMAQRFFNIVLLEKVRDDIRRNNKLNYHLYLALKKSLFKPAAFYKGLLLPLALSKTCNLREAMIIGSVISKVSVPSNHSAAALLKLAEMPYFGSTSLFIKIFINKRYALPRRVIDALVNHFCQIENEARDLPVIWHQSLLAFVQRYKFEILPEQKEQIRALIKLHNHHQITSEIRRELFVTNNNQLNINNLNNNNNNVNAINDDMEIN